MAWWNRNSKPEDEVVLLSTPVIEDPKSSSAGTYSVPADALVNALPHPEPPKDPEPDLSTKPKDVVGYCFGYVCSKKHIAKPFENITVDGYKERRACQTCGGVSKPAVVKRTAEAQWGNTAHVSVFDMHPKPRWGWFNAYWESMGRVATQWPGDTGRLWTKHEFAHYLETPKKRKK